jgi:hypothetical protein
MNNVLVTAHFFKIDNPLVPAAFFLTIMSTEGLSELFIVALFVLLLLFLSRDFSLRPHNGTDDV